MDERDLPTAWETPEQDLLVADAMAVVGTIEQPDYKGNIGRLVDLRRVVAIVEELWGLTPLCRENNGRLEIHASSTI